MLVLAHLRHQALSDAERDYNTKAEVVDPQLDEIEGNTTLGVTAQDMTQQMSEALSVRTETGQPVTAGALVTRVEPGGPGDKIGLRPNDVIVTFDGEVIENNRQLRKKVAATKPNTTVEIEVIRAGEGSRTQEITVRESF